MLEPILCGLLAQAPLLPKLRGHFAEFLDDASPVGLWILSSSTCVGLRYGYVCCYSGFSRHLGLRSSLLQFRSVSRLWICCDRFAAIAPTPLTPGLPFPARAPQVRPHISGHTQCRNFYLLSIGCASRPRLRSRLTQGRSASPWKPRIFGRKDSHLPLATHSGILSSRSSTAPPGTASLNRQCSPTTLT